ncbi:N-acetylneuraminate synthase family protein [Sulfitobacter sp.]|uniref:N-acetylneuraminate synthase family protein n=1 Tax=Sulfitobacter sp. TaxID=1903071 RepID=UPI003298D4EB
MTQKFTPASPTWLDAPAPGAAATIIAEVAQAHDGSLGTAHAFIDAAAAAGADAIKFQTHIAAKESTIREPWRKKFGWQDDTRFDYWRRMEFTEEQWHGLAAHAHEAGLHFLSSPFSPEAVALLRRVGVPGWKIASGEVDEPRLIKAITDTKQPVILSSGMSALAETDRAAQCIQEAGCPLAVLQCTTSYPVAPEEVGLNVMQDFALRYPQAAVGLSDHSATIYPGLAAVTLGAQVIEVHLTLARNMFGPDVSSSLTPDELKMLCEGVRMIEVMRGNPVDKDSHAARMEPMRAIFGKSVVASRDLKAGAVLEASDLAAKKPGDGVPAARIEEFVGRRLTRALKCDDLLDWGDLDD